jgi:hypothetical protein
MDERIRLRELDPPERTQLTPEDVLSAGGEFLNHFDVEISPDSTQEFISAMDQLNPRFQGERALVRFELEKDQTKWPEETIDITMNAAEAMRMLVPQTPFEGNLDTVVVLGAARQAPLDRMRYAARCMYRRASLGTQTANVFREGALIFGGSKRILNDLEKENVANYAPEAETEADLVEASMMHLDAEQQILTEEFQCYPKIMHYGMKIVDSEKAGTADVIEAVLSEMLEYNEKTGLNVPNTFRLGAVTTQIYQVATALDVARAAKKYGFSETFTAGNPSDPAIVQRRTTATYLSEVLRTLKSASMAKAAGVKETGLSNYPIRPYGIGDYYI